MSLGEAITGLWAAHLNAKNGARATKEELRDIRAHEKQFEVKLDGKTTTALFALLFATRDVSGKAGLVPEPALVLVAFPPSTAAPVAVPNPYPQLPSCFGN